MIQKVQEKIVEKIVEKPVVVERPVYHNIVSFKIYLIIFT